MLLLDLRPVAGGFCQQEGSGFTGYPILFGGFWQESRGTIRFSARRRYVADVLTRGVPTPILEDHGFGLSSKVTLKKF
jgi:hypothetical protein